MGFVNIWVPAYYMLDRLNNVNVIYTLASFSQRLFVGFSMTSLGRVFHVFSVHSPQQNKHINKKNKIKQFKKRSPTPIQSHCLVVDFSDTQTQHYCTYVLPVYISN